MPFVCLMYEGNWHLSGKQGNRESMLTSKYIYQDYSRKNFQGWGKWVFDGIGGRGRGGINSCFVTKWIPSSRSVEIQEEKYSKPLEMFCNTGESIPHIFSWQRNPFSNNRLHASKYLWASIVMATSEGGGSWWM